MALTVAKASPSLLRVVEEAAVASPGLMMCLHGPIPSIPAMQTTCAFTSSDPDSAARRRGLAKLFAATMLGCLALSGCTTIDMTSGRNVPGNRTYFGIVTVRAPVDGDAPLNTPRIRQLEVATWGMRFDQGISVGYVEDRVLEVPLDCRLVVFIRSPVNLAHAEKMLRATAKENLCITQISH